MARGFSQYSSELSHYSAIMLLFACFAVFIQFPSTAFASAPAQNSAPPCQAEIQRIETAKGDLKQEMQRPADGWVKLGKTLAGLSRHGVV
ncbi:hypothetical protein [Acinetobacter sp. WCHAc010034]|uniref:hypothetical protein n=1 Tax=Acinetobacter sp. WCHAc010034 TaxID=1879049 RepID=UPI000A94CB81|nr:hypothetical protein [Acinetobacter sp. WCHAc010034]